MLKLMTSNRLASVALLFSVAVSGNAAGTPAVTPEVIDEIFLSDGMSIPIASWPLPPVEERKVVGSFCYIWPCDKDSPNWENIYEN